MTPDELIRCLGAIPMPAGVEEWLQPNDVNSSSPVNRDFQRGVYAMLAALGVLTDNGIVTSPMAYYFIRSLSASIVENRLDENAWQGMAHETCSGTGAQLVRLLEKHRLDCEENPAPLRIVRAVTAVIKGRHNGNDVYLMQYDPKARQFQPIGGKQENYDADGLAALTRELGEELGIASLQTGVDFQAHPLKENVQVNEVSASIHVITRYDHSFYHLTDIQFALNLDEIPDITRWLSSEELAAHHTHDGLAITTLFDEHIPGVLPTLSYSINGDI